MLDIGRYKGKMVTTDDASTTNRHVFVLGESCSGKTVECQRLITSAVEQGGYGDCFGYAWNTC